jgi:ubiquinone/menaquinone biosynthesis C-methylase UbiE
VPHPATAVQETAGGIAPHLRRLLEFVEPDRDDVCLDVARGRGPMPAALRPRVRHMTAVDATPAPEEPGRNGRMSTVEFGTGPVRITGGPDDGDRPPAMATREDPRPRPAAPAVKADATALPYRDGTFSLVTARFSLYTLGEPERVLRELLRVCRPGGSVRVYPLLEYAGGTLAGLPALLRRLEDAGCSAELVPVAYRFLRGADRALVLTRHV